VNAIILGAVWLVFWVFCVAADWYMDVYLPDKEWRDYHRREADQALLRVRARFDVDERQGK
jgi:hypothetical protein